ncbi:MAG: SusD/RagB family nutrient-binding outer membrane lipoprotein [Bacteroidales bacterium]|nr:SusD/RagB family nutrient-binding outer membrane lipoprotein [Bacteroidales bacterium]
MNKIFKHILTFFVIAAASAGCTDKFGEMNTNPYRPETLPVHSFFPAMLDCLASPEENPCQRNNTFWACFGGYVTAPHSWTRTNLYSTFNIDDAWNQWTVDWYYTAEGGKGLYPGWFSVQRLTEGKGYYFQMAQLLRVYVMQMVASLQGPLPYSKVANGDFYVSYDDERTAWHAMFDDLDAAIVEIQSAAASGSAPLAAVDRIYGGDNVKWLKFANTLKLRMAMRISNVEPEYAKQKAEEAVASGVMEGISDSAYDNLNGRYNNGFYTLAVGWGGEVMANACITSYMNGYQDPRREKYFLPSAHDGSYMGVRSGIAGMNKSNYVEYSHMIYSEEANKTAPMPVMLASEAAFLRAEGALKGWNMGGDAKSFYEQGIRLSFDQWGASGASDYIANSTRVPGDYVDSKTPANNIANKCKITVAWEDNVSDAKKLERIITQKWIAGYPNGLEAWSDFRRTGYPYIFPPKDNMSNNEVDSELGQRRLRFSQSEYNRNNDNVTAAVQMLSNKQDKDYTDLWWAQNQKKY